jgi:hypothetical protein
MHTSNHDSNEAVRDGVKRFSEPQPKRPYATPRLVVHGTVETITQSPGGAHTDGIEGSHAA